MGASWAFEYSEISKIDNSNLRLGSLADRSFGASAGRFGKRFHKILDPRIDAILGVGEIVAHVRSFAGRGTLVDRSILHICTSRAICIFVFSFTFSFTFSFALSLTLLCFSISIVYPPN